MMLRVNRLAYPITTLGFGTRAALWLQGCTIRCPGCGSRDTWEADGGYSIDEKQLARQIADISLELNLDGLTITGGEPSDQGQGVVQLISDVRKSLEQARAQHRGKYDVLIFSGRTAKEILSGYPGLWTAADLLICGPYIPNNPSKQRLIASGNQTMELRSTLAKKRYGPAEEQRGIQLAMDGAGITFAGITNPGDLEILTDELKKRGIALEGCSWEQQ